MCTSTNNEGRELEREREILLDIILKERNRDKVRKVGNTQIRNKIERERKTDRQREGER